MAGHARQTTRLSPAAVTVHDDGDMQTGWFQEFHPSSQAARPRRVDSRKSLFHTKYRPKKFSGPGLALPRGPNQCLHVIEIPLQGSAARRRQAVLGLRQPPVERFAARDVGRVPPDGDRKSTRLNSSHGSISYAVFCLKKKNTIT